MGFIAQHIAWVKKTKRIHNSNSFYAQHDKGKFSFLSSDSDERSKSAEHHQKKIGCFHFSCWSCIAFAGARWFQSDVGLTKCSGQNAECRLSITFASRKIASCGKSWKLLKNISDRSANKGLFLSGGNLIELTTKQSYHFWALKFDFQKY